MVRFGGAVICYGVDFSGGAAPWRATARSPSVWIATIDGGGPKPSLLRLEPVQALAGSGPPFARLVALLRGGDFAVAAIDAPFSLPAGHLPGGRHRTLLARFADLPDASDRPFPRGEAVVALAREVAPLERNKKPFRACEQASGVTARSTLWNGPRGGAPFAAACLRLIGESGRPCWPWVRQPGGLLAEAFPAAQLKRWGLAHRGYGRAADAEAREAILAGLESRIDLSGSFRSQMRACADALDAAVCGLAAVAVARGEAGLPAAPTEEGWIAIASR